VTSQPQVSVRAGFLPPVLQGCGVVQRPPGWPPPWSRPGNTPSKPCRYGLIRAKCYVHQWW